MAATRNVFVELFWKVHPALHRWTGGRIGGSLMGLPVQPPQRRTTRRIPVVVPERRRG